MEQEIIGVLSLNGDIEIERIAQSLKARPHQVRYCVSKLIECGALRYRARLNLLAAGFSVLDLFFTLGQVQHKAPVTLETLASSSHEHLVLLEEVGGRFSHHIRMATRNASDAHSVIQRIGSKCGGFLAEKWTANHLAFSHFGLKRFNDKSKSTETCAIESMPSNHACDPLDLRLLQFLSSQRFGSRRDIARGLGLAPSTVNSRIQSLLQSGIISRFEYEVDLRTLGLHPYRLLLSSTRSDPAFFNALYRYCAVHPTTTTLTTCLGVWDFEIECVTEDPDEVSDFVKGLNKYLGEFLARIEVLPVFRPLFSACWPDSQLKIGTGTAQSEVHMHPQRRAA